MQQLIEKVENWAADKGLEKVNPRNQLLKMTEEVGEVAGALARGNDYELKGEIGDVVVTAIVLTMQKGWTLEECLRRAYNKIADRKGKMVNGVFVKEADL